MSSSFRNLNSTRIKVKTSISLRMAIDRATKTEASKLISDAASSYSESTASSSTEAKSETPAIDWGNLLTKEGTSEECADGDYFVRVSRNVFSVELIKYRLDNWLVEVGVSAKRILESPILIELLSTAIFFSEKCNATVDRYGLISSTAAGSIVTFNSHKAELETLAAYIGSFTKFVEYSRDRMKEVVKSCDDTDLFDPGYDDEDQKMLIDAVAMKIDELLQLDEEDPMNKIMYCLYIGNVLDSCDVRQLRNNQIRRIVRVLYLHGGIPQADIDPPIRYHFVKMQDLADEDLREHVFGTVCFIYEGIRNDEAVLVHCRKGKSRSVALVAAFILVMSANEITVNDAVAIIKASRPRASPNEFFLQQLEQFRTSSALPDCKRLLQQRFPFIQWTDFRPYLANLREQGGQHK